MEAQPTQTPRIVAATLFLATRVPAAVPTRLRPRSPTSQGLSPPPPTCPSHGRTTRALRPLPPLVVAGGAGAPPNPAERKRGGGGGSGEIGGRRRIKKKKK